MASYEVILEGGKPWGLRLQGGKEFSAPLKIGQVTSSSKADQKGLSGGEEILEINEHDTTNITQADAMNLIKETGGRLQLRLKGKPKSQDDDDDFLADLRDQFSGTGNTKKEASTTFNMLQQHMDAGHGTRVLSAFDKPNPDRNKSIVASANTKMRNLNVRGEYEAIMAGGRPWGIRLQGGKGTDTPLHLGQVAPRGKGERMGLIPGDIIISINDTEVENLTLDEAQNIIKSTGEELYILLKGDTTYHVKDEDEEERDAKLYEMIKQDAKPKAGPQIRSNKLRILKKEVEAGVVDRPKSTSNNPEATTVLLNQPLGGYNY